MSAYHDFFAMNAGETPLYKVCEGSLESGYRMAFRDLFAERGMGQKVLDEKARRQRIKANRAKRA